MGVPSCWSGLTNATSPAGDSGEGFNEHDVIAGATVK